MNQVTVSVKNGKAQIVLNGKAQIVPANGRSKNFAKFALKGGRVLASIYAKGDATATLSEVGKTKNSHKFAVKNGKVIATVYIAKLGHKVGQKATHK